MAPRRGPSASSTYFRFLDLPDLVRDQIYRLMIDDEFYSRSWYLHESAETSTGIWLYWRDESSSMKPTVSMVCPQMAVEARRVFDTIPRIYYPYLHLNSLAELDKLDTFPYLSTPLAPRGVALLKRFGMYWNFFHDFCVEQEQREENIAVIADVVVTHYPLAVVTLRSSLMGATGKHYFDEFMQKLLQHLGMSDLESAHLPAASNSGRRWTVAEIQTLDVYKTLTQLHNVLHKYDQGLQLG